MKDLVSGIVTGIIVVRNYEQVKNCAEIFSKKERKNEKIIFTSSILFDILYFLLLQAAFLR